ncbi:MAG: GMC oxidoreductase, partial [Pyrinomonadaceae bacterium]
HQGLKDAAFLPEKLVTKFWQIGPPKKFGREYRDELAKANNVTVILNANASNIQIDKQGGHVTRVDLKTLTGKVGQVHAKKFVLCCGCIENARLLLVSNSITPDGLGNDGDLVGRFFMEHPTIRCGIVASDDDYDLADRYNRNFLNGVQYWPGIVAADLLQEEKIILHCCATVDVKADEEDGTKVAQEIWHDYKTYGRLSDELLDKVWQVAKDLDHVAYNIYRRFVLGKGVISPIKYLFLTAHSEQAPNPDSRVLLSEERDALGIRKIQLKWQLTELDKFTIRKLTEAIGLEFGRQNVGRVRIEEWLLASDNTWPDELVGQFHHMGTTRMADDPREGVVDKNCTVHGIRNLFIAGSSVFPTSGYVNPTLTIVALTLRLAEHLKTQFA